MTENASAREDIASLEVSWGDATHKLGFDPEHPGSCVCGQAFEVATVKRGKHRGRVIRRCPECYRAYQKRWREENPQYHKTRKVVRNPERDRRRHFLKKYGVTIEQRDAMLAAQGSQCPICAVQLSTDRLLTSGTGRNGRFALSTRGDGAVVDHCHESGRVRGILCSRCNRALGFFSDDPSKLRAAADYRERR